MNIINDLGNLLNSGTTAKNTGTIVFNNGGLNIPSSISTSGQINYIDLVGGGSTTTTTGSSILPTTSTGSQQDFRVKLSYLSTSSMTYPGVLAPLSDTNGLLFPYTPSINVSHEADYENMSMTHANTNYLAYSRTPNVTISINAKFTVQNKTEGLYALAALHFLRSTTKMYFGETDAASGLAGTPPPMLELNGYGTYMFNKVRCILKTVSYGFEENMQMVTIIGSNGYVRLPALFSVQLQLTAQTTARAQRVDFSLDQYRSGALMETTPNNNGWI